MTDLTACWTRILAKPLELKDGRILRTLGDVRVLMQRLPARHFKNSHWEHAGGLLDAAPGGSRAALNEAMAEVEQALRMDRAA